MTPSPSLARSRRSSPLQRRVSKNKPNLVARIALKGQPNKICGTLDHPNANFGPKQALAELAQAMFGQPPRKGARARVGMAWPPMSKGGRGQKRATNL